MPASEKIVSLFEEHTDIIRRGKEAKPVEYGHKIWLNEVEAEDGTIRKFRTVTLNPRRYFDKKSNQWKDAASYQQSDLPALIFALQQALGHCFSEPIPGQEDTEAGPSEDEAGGKF